MRELACVRSQGGMITIFICMVMLLLMTAMVVTAFSLSTTNLQAVGNVQARDEALAAANLVLEQVVGEPFVDDPALAARDDFPVFLSGGDTADYLVDVVAPACVRAERASVSTATSETLPGMSATSAWNTVWELDATATAAATGVSVRVLQGVRVLLSDARKNAVCS